MKLDKKNIIIAGGGTGGHLFPAIAIADEIKKNKYYKFVFFGSKYGMESSYFKKYGNDYYLINIRGIQRSFSIKSLIVNLSFPFRFTFSFIKTLLIFIKINPVLIIGTGGYASGIPLIVGAILKKKILIQEQNSVPGFTSKMLSKYADVACTAYDTVSTKLKCSSILTGNPIRRNLIEIDNKKAKKKLSLDNSFTLLIIGGSQGAKKINNFIADNLDKINSKINIVWQCGIKNYQYIKNKSFNDNVMILPYIDDINIAYSAADLVITRAGALALTEIAFFKKAMIVIPLKKSAQNHQFYNAKYYQSKKAGILLEEDEIKKLPDIINKLSKRGDEIKQLQKNIESIAKPKASKDIYNVIKKLLKDINV